MTKTIITAAFAAFTLVASPLALSSTALAGGGHGGGHGFHGGHGGGGHHNFNGHHNFRFSGGHNSSTCWIFKDGKRIFICGGSGGSY